ncbi:hypothetical protein [uncultured Cohaesibacter sp.]|uniref:SGNH/GDSL hydrolase family protein n=1 Tax=uncultured Cohaesibacter sp. TaxID=1002546 RepID=UPI002930E968|nr:hypothetical protein [uncultured Cohaesibacter sp.]
MDQGNGRVKKAKSLAFVGQMVCACLLFQFVLVEPASSVSLSELGAGADMSQPVRVKPDDGRYEVALSFFERIFKRSSRKKKTETKSEPVKKKASNPAAAPKPVIQTVPKDDDAFVIAVFGDEFSQDIGWGLKDAFAKMSDVKVELHSIPGSGIVYRASRNKPLFDPDDYFAQHPFNFAVVMVGLNDRVTMPGRKDKDGTEISPPYEFRTDSWARAYQREIDRLRLAFAEQDKPVFWVGLPPVGSEKLSGDMRYLNDLVSSRLTERDEEFIDIWDAFSNEEGAFSLRGPDLAGEEVRLRLKNGIRFTQDGRRKLAYFVEKLVIRVLSQSVDEDVLPKNLTVADETALRDGLGARRNIFVLRKPSLNAEQLINPSVFALSFSNNSLSEDELSASRYPPKYRVDDFSWKGGN